MFDRHPTLTGILGHLGEMLPVLHLALRPSRVTNVRATFRRRRRSPIPAPQLLRHDERQLPHDDAEVRHRGAWRDRVMFSNKTNRPRKKKKKKKKKKKRIAPKKKRKFGTFGRQRASQTTVLASFAIQIFVVGIAATNLLVARSYGREKLAIAIFFALAALSFTIYMFVLTRVDRMAARRRDVLTTELCK